jgi:pre-mRNA-splicing factor SYF2
VGEMEEAQDLSQLTGRKKKLFELRLKMNKARKQNHSAVVAEKKRQEVPTKEDANIAKKKRYEAAVEQKTAELEANGLDGTKKYLLDSVEFAAKQYKKADAKAMAIAGARSKQEGIAMAFERRSNLAFTPEVRDVMRGCKQGAIGATRANALAFFGGQCYS